MMLFSRTIGLPVITGDDATSLGTVRDLTLDAAGAVVAGVRLSGGPDRTDVLPWTAVAAVGPDALIVRSRHAADPEQTPLPAHHSPLGSRVLTDLGTEHGTVQDIAFDAASGRVLTLYTALGDIPGARLLGLGSYALVVRAQP
ncbi:hypothetical protein CFC35_20985 [Streptomyces sp. FBKL.4005]|uniref:PRC-barrel domain-containing protein n=1 Tax=Streptomyces sp. FBKL.4005 TaxID=2015515 RepID=UPI000B96A15E|nr:PRC-barrel domain-containing protein [Streptomyces sp. FBKL.4005]OYP16677.1 hypothetical protein CFC35_20985 [Streptomyces sp. FBKL.4005]